MDSTAVRLDTASGVVDGDLTVPGGVTRGIVLFAHGSGSGRRSPRNRFVAAVLQRQGLATLLVDLVTEEEAAGSAPHPRFDIRRLAERVLGATEWVRRQRSLAGLDIGYFGASTGAAAAMVAAAHEPRGIRAIVSRGGRPDLAGAALGLVMAPTLLIVGGADRTVITMNRMALPRLSGPKELVIIPGAGHLFQEPGAMEQVADTAAGWFRDHLTARAPRGVAVSGP